MTIVVSVIAIVIAVPMMIVFAAAALAIPIASEELRPIVVGGDPSGPSIWRPRPITVMPAVVSPDRIPIAVHPKIFGTGSRRKNPNHARWWRRTDCDSDGYLSENRHHRE